MKTLIAIIVTVLVVITSAKAQLRAANLSVRSQTIIEDYLVKHDSMRVVLDELNYPIYVDAYDCKEDCFDYTEYLEGYAYVTLNPHNAYEDLIAALHWELDMIIRTIKSMRDVR